MIQNRMVKQKSKSAVGLEYLLNNPAVTTFIAQKLKELGKP